MAGGTQEMDAGGDRGGVASMSMPVPGVLVRLCEVVAHEDDNLQAWNRRLQLQEPLAIEGFRTARRYRVAGGEPAYMTVYKCLSIDVLAAARSRAALAASDARLRSDGTRYWSRVRNTMQFACRETLSVGNGMGGSAIVVQCKPIRGRENAARAFIRDNFGPQRMPALVRMALWEVDTALSDLFAQPAPKPPARNARTVGEVLAVAAANAPVAIGPRWVLALESCDVTRMALAVHDCLLGCESDKTGLLAGSWSRYQLLSAYHGSQSA